LPKPYRFACFFRTATRTALSSGLSAECVACHHDDAVREAGRYAQCNYFSHPPPTTPPPPPPPPPPPTPPPNQPPFLGFVFGHYVLQFRSCHKPEPPDRLAANHYLYDAVPGADLGVPMITNAHVPRAPCAVLFVAGRERQFAEQQSAIVPERRR